MSCSTRESKCYLLVKSEDYFCLHGVSSYLESLDLLREAMQGYRQRLGDKHPYVADALCHVSEVLNHMGKVTAAAKVVKQAQLIYDSAVKKNELMSKSKGYGGLQLSLGRNFIEAGKYKEALAAFNGAFVVFTALAKSLRVEAEWGVAQSILGLAEALRLLSQFKKAKGLIGKAGVMVVKLFGEQNVRVSDCLLQLGCLNSDTGLHEEANSLFAKSHSTRKKELTLNHPSTVELFRVFAENFARVGYFEEGLEPLRVAHALSVKMFNKRSLAAAKALYVRAKGSLYSSNVCFYNTQYVCSHIGFRTCRRR
jgi:tetratricopeptide (TPR) repeat protein